MRFRPCIDIHNGKVKQIVGGTLRDAGDTAEENFVSGQDAAFYANLYRRHQIAGGHVIMLNAQDSPYYNETRHQAMEALAAYPGGLMAGGGITPANAAAFLEAGASHVIVTSWVFRDGMVSYPALKELCAVTGRERLVLDVSCRKRDGAYYIVTDRWQKFTGERITERLLDDLCGYADEFLIHAVDVEGKASGIERELVELLGDWHRIPITYAGGVGSMDHLRQLREWGQDHLDVTVGSALDLFGGSLKLQEVLDFMQNIDRRRKS
ncbi:MAG: phosphoribosylformimino-5-aminoimidazole carboxamide ribotide isomerase [Lachnospiraceae bacterium]|nr:phosphoribosylformimino-5-aminoimidazole carboxamide ribotide isomerase [Lachnospiraceae bacterium]